MERFLVELPGIWYSGDGTLIEAVLSRYYQCDIGYGKAIEIVSRFL